MTSKYKSMVNTQYDRLILLLTCEMRFCLSTFLCLNSQHKHLLTIKQLYEIGPLSERRLICLKFALKTFRSIKFANWFPKTNFDFLLTIITVHFSLQFRLGSNFQIKLNLFQIRIQIFRLRHRHLQIPIVVYHGQQLNLLC